MQEVSTILKDREEITRKLRDSGLDDPPTLYTRPPPGRGRGRDRQRGGSNYRRYYMLNINVHVIDTIATITAIITIITSHHYHHYLSSPLSSPSSSPSSPLSIIIIVVVVVVVIVVVVIVEVIGTDLVKEGRVIIRRKTINNSNM